MNFNRKIILVVLVSISTFSSARANSNQPVTCDFKALAPHVGEDPFEQCSNHRPKMEAFTQSCLDPVQKATLYNRASAMARLEQLKLIYDQETFYASRLPYTSKFHSYAWKDMHDRWNRRAKEDEYLLQLDTDRRLGRSKCALHARLGLDCEGEVGLDVMNIKRDQAKMTAIANSRQYHSTPSLVRDLLKASLNLRAAELIAQKASLRTRILTFRGAEHDKRVKEEKDKEEVRQALANYIDLYYPELYLNKDLQKLLGQINARLGLNAALEDALNKAHAESHELIGVDREQIIVQNIVLEKLSKPSWSDGDEQAVETEFTKSYQEIIQKMDGQIRHSQSSLKWTLAQDYLVGSAMDIATANHDTQRAGIFQSLVCKHGYELATFEKRKSVAMNVGTVLALATGVGATFELGAAVVIGLSATSFATINTMSVYNYTEARHERAEQEKLFLLHAAGVDATAMDDANSAVSESRNWLIINLAMAGPTAVLKEITIAKASAEAAGNVARVAELTRYAKLTSSGTFVANSLFAGVTSGESGYENIVKQIKEKTHPAPAAKDQAGGEELY